MSSSIVEVIYLTLKPTVKPEDRKNVEGNVFNDAIRAAKQASGYLWTTWGRTIEDENNVVWIVGWQDTTGGVPLTSLEPILEQDTIPISFHATLTPPVSDETLAASRAIELAVLSFPSTISPDDKAALDKELINLRSSLLDIKLQDDVRSPRSFSMGWIDRPANLQHPESPSGHALSTLLVGGWRSKAEHEAARKTENFTTAIAPIRERMLPPVQALSMRHVTFKGREEHA